jgi:hypothetical protein
MIICCSVIQPTAARSSFPYTPEYCMQALRHFYYDLREKQPEKIRLSKSMVETINVLL